MRLTMCAIIALAAATAADARAPLTRDAAKAHADLLFGIADVNRDGTVTRAEFDAYIKATNGDAVKSGAMFDELDASHAGQVTRQEVETDALAKFDRADTNHDGIIDPTEIAARRAAKQAAAAAASQPAAPSYTTGNGAAPAEPPPAAAMGQ